MEKKDKTVVQVKLSSNNTDEQNIKAMAEFLRQLMGTKKDDAKEEKKEEKTES